MPDDEMTGRKANESFPLFFMSEKKFLHERGGKLQVAYTEPFLLYYVIKDLCRNIDGNILKIRIPTKIEGMEMKECMVQ